MKKIKDLRRKIRFTRYIEVLMSGCWRWTGCSQYGYGVFHLNGKNHRAHRLSYEWSIGRISKKLQLDHLCRNTFCVNPSHLEAVTSRTNTLRGTGPTAVNFAKEVCKNGHALTEANTYYRSDYNWRQCKTCAHEASSRWFSKTKGWTSQARKMCICGKGIALKKNGEFRKHGCVL